jgi:hypothetical protein
MFKKRKRSLRKNTVFLVCVAFIFMIFPEVTQAATKPSFERFPFPEESISLISAVFYFASLNLSHLGYDLAFFYSQSSNKTKFPKQGKNGNGKKRRNKQNSSFNSNGNSTSKKRPESKDDD